MVSIKIGDALKLAADKVNADTDLRVVVPGTESVKADVKQYVRTKSNLLNLLLGEDELGSPTGRVMEIFGDNSHGKSTILQILMNAFQAANGVSTLLDSESSWNRDRAVQMGHNPERHLSVDVDTVEMGFKVIRSILLQFIDMFGGSIPLIIGWDTIAASPTDGELKLDEYAAGMMYKPRLIRQQLRVIGPLLDKARAQLVFVNQTIEGPNQKSSVKTTPGGGGIKFWSSHRLQVTRVATYNDMINKERSVGIISKVKAVKNKLNPPFKEIELPLDFAAGIDPVLESFNYLLDKTSVVNLSGSRIKIVGFTDTDLSFYKKEIYQVVQDNPGLLDWMQSQVQSHWLSGDTF